MLRFMTRSLCAAGLITVMNLGIARADDCAGTHAIDRCLVGTWKMTTNGTEQWMRAHIRNYHVTSIQTTDNTITLKADGTFTTGNSKVTTRGVSNTGASGTGTMNAQASGVWSAADGKFNICARASTMEGTTTVTGNGHSTTTAVHPAVPPVATRPYTCSANIFTASQPLHGDTVVSTYTKVP
jgi:hypothetical protein